MDEKKGSDDVRAEVRTWVSRALDALEEVKEVVVRSSQAGKIRIDTAFLEKEKGKAMLRLGEKVFEWAEDEGLELPPEAQPLLETVRSLARQIEEHRRELASVRDES